jgi:hypothetical protein
MEPAGPKPDVVEPAVVEAAVVEAAKSSRTDLEPN